MIKMQLEFRGLNGSKLESSNLIVKNYLIDRFGLQVFIQTIQKELLIARHLNVQCIIS